METGPLVSEVADPLELAVPMRVHVYQINLNRSRKRGGREGGREEGGEGEGGRGEEGGKPEEKYAHIATMYNVDTCVACMQFHTYMHLHNCAMYM